MEGYLQSNAAFEMESVAALIVERMTDGVLLFDSNGHCLYANDAVGRLLSSIPNTLLGKPMAQLFPQSVVPLDAPDRQETRDYFLAATKRWYQLRAFATPQGQCVSFLDVTERKRTEAALRESEQRFRALVTTTSYAVYRMSPDWKEMYQLDGRGFIVDTSEPNRSWLETYIPPQDQPLVMEVIQKAIRTKGVFELEHRVLRVDGTLGWMLSRAIPLLNDADEIIEWFGAASDVTARKQAEEALQEEHAILESFYNSMPFMMGVAEVDGGKMVALSANQNLAHFLGRPTDDFRGHTAAELGDPQEIEHLWVSQFRRCQRENRVIRFEYQDPRLPATSWLNGTVSFIGRGPMGRPRFSFAVEDITERKRIQEALRESEELFRTLSNTAPALIWYNDAQGKNVFVNQFFLHFTGKTEEEIRGESWHGLVHLDEAEAYVADYLEAVREQRSWHNRNRVRRHDGEWRWLDNYAQPLFGSDGTYLGHVGISSDITSTLEAERRVQAERQRLYDLFMQAPSAIALVRGPEHVYELANDLVLQILGTHRSIIGKPIHEVFPEGEGQSFFDLLDTVYQTGQPFIGNEIPAMVNRKGDGTLDVLYLNFVYQPYYNAAEEIDGVLTYANDVTETVLARKRIEESEAKYRTLFESMDEGFFLADVLFDEHDSPIDIYYVEVNPAATRMVGQDWAGRYLREIDPNYELYWYEIFGRVVQTGQSERQELYAAPLQSWFDFYVFKIGDADSRRVAVITKDVTERKRMEQALRDSERRVQVERQRLYDLIMQASSAIGVLRESGHVYELVNPLGMQIIGAHRQVIGKSIRETVPEVEGQGYLETLDAVYQTGKPFIGNEIPGQFNKNGDGTLVPSYFNVVYQPSYNAAGEIDSIVTYVNDVTDIVLSRKRVEESEEHLRTLANSMPQLVWSANASGEIDFFNQRLHEYADIHQNEQGIYGWQAIIHPDDQENTKRIWEHAMKTGETFENEQRMHMKDGTYRWHLVRGLPIHNEDGSISRWYGTKTDVKHLKQLEQQRTNFLGVVSHELKTPVTSVKAFAEVLENRFRKAGDEKTASLLGKMNEQMGKLTRLISDLLDVTKIEAGKLHFHEEFFPFDTLVDDILEEVQRTTTHTLQREGTTSVTVCGDRERIGQVLTNLLTNATKYSPNASKVVVSTSCSEQEVTLCVRDFGIGIAQDKVPHVFERFFRETGAREDTFAGLGLGLYVASEIISRQGGRIWVESEKGRGSTLCFSLPIGGSKNIRRSNEMFAEGK